MDKIFLCNIKTEFINSNSFSWRFWNILISNTFTLLKITKDPKQLFILVCFICQYLLHYKLKLRNLEIILLIYFKIKIISPVHVNIKNTFSVKHTTKLRGERGIVFASLFDVWLKRRQVESHVCFAFGLFRSIVLLKVYEDYAVLHR